MQTLVDFLEALIIAWVIVYATYGLALLAMRSIWWTARFASWAILYATFGVTLLIVRSIWWTIRSLARFGQGANNIQSSRAGSAAAVSHSAVGHEAKSMPSPRLQASFPEVAISIREAREALFAYERQVLTARSEIRETVTRTRETIAQTQALMAQVDAVSRGISLAETF
jgi:hypothetical protein